MDRFYRISSQALWVALLAMPLTAGASAPGIPQPVQLQQPAAIPIAMPSQQQAPSDVNTELTTAVGTGTPEEIQRWLKAGGNPNGSDIRNIPLLSLAAIRRDGNALGAMQALLAVGADINIRDQYQQTPLIYATRLGLFNNVKFLVLHGADAQATDRSGNTAHDYAVAAARSDLVNILQPPPHPAPPAPMTNPVVSTPPAASPASQTPTATPPTPTSAAPAHVAPQPSGLDRHLLLQTIRSLAFHSCATEYWRYCNRIDQATDLPVGQIKTEADAQETQAGNDAELLRQRFGAKENYILHVTDSSRNDILQQLGAFSTNANRKSEGIGTRADMAKRCGKIADDWEFGMPSGAANNDAAQAAPNNETAASAPAPVTENPLPTVSSRSAVPNTQRRPANNRGTQEQNKVFMP